MNFHSSKTSFASRRDGLRNFKTEGFILTGPVLSVRTLALDKPPTLPTSKSKATLEATDCQMVWRFSLGQTPIDSNLQKVSPGGRSLLPHCPGVEYFSDEVMCHTRMSFKHPCFVRPQGFSQGHFFEHLFGYGDAAVGEASARVAKLPRTFRSPARPPVTGPTSGPLWHGQQLTG